MRICVMNPRRFTRSSTHIYFSVFSIFRYVRDREFVGVLSLVRISMTYACLSCAIIIRFVHARSSVPKTECKFRPPFLHSRVPRSNVSSIGNGLRLACGSCCETRVSLDQKNSCAFYFAAQIKVELRERAVSFGQDTGLQFQLSAFRRFSRDSSAQSVGYMLIADKSRIQVTIKSIQNNNVRLD